MNNAPDTSFNKIVKYFQNRWGVAVLAFVFVVVVNAVNITTKVTDFCAKRGWRWCTLVDCERAQLDPKYRRTLTIEELTKCGIK